MIQPLWEAIWRVLNKLKMSFCVSHNVPDAAATPGQPTTLVVTRADTPLEVPVYNPDFSLLVPFIVLLLVIFQSFITCRLVCKAHKLLQNPTLLPILKQL